eukprot:scaffold10056_cov164-Amphora_coffeaeformis.AAC.12
MARVQHLFVLIPLLLLHWNGALGFVPQSRLSCPSLGHATTPLPSPYQGPLLHKQQPRRLSTNPRYLAEASSDALEKSRKWQQLFHPVKSNSLTSTALLVALDVVFRQVFQRAKIRFPSSLAGCGVVLVALLVAQQLKVTTGTTTNSSSEETSTILYQQLQPGASLLAQWLPVFFVPSLVTLPLAAGLGSVSDFVKVSVVVVGGFLFTLYSTAFAVEAVRKAKHKNVTARKTMSPEEYSAAASGKEPIATATIPQPTATTPTKPFSGKILSQLAAAAVASGLLATWGFVGAQASYYLTSLCFLTSTLASFVFGARLPAKFTQWVHPLVTCTALTWGVVGVLAQCTGHTFRRLLRTYRTGSLTAAGDILLFLLGPAVVSLAVTMFDRRRLVRDNAAAVATAVSVATVGGVGGTALLVRLAGIGIPAVRLSLLSRNITSPLAMAMASLLGADVSLAVSMVVISGLFGANFGARLLTAAGISDPVARGLGMGAAAHGLGTAALARSEPDAFSFSAIAMALVASAATVTVSIPVLRRVVLELALG